MKRDLHAEVSARIIAELEAGAAPWVKPWSATPGANMPCNAVSNRPYSGSHDGSPTGLTLPPSDQN
jgi:antirestriction protein ArdC